MSDPIRPGFWKDVPLDDLNPTEWEMLCDGCGKCCLNKLEDEETGIVVLTRVACRLLDGQSCRCSQYPIRHQFVPECIVLSPKSLIKNMYWLPQTCAYRLRAEGRQLYDWHPLNSGDPESVHAAGMSVRGLTIPEFEVDEEEWEEMIIEEPGT
jgi:uncharacterized cysteine cluster protein YcgN (CxxCxxCC family)